MPTDKRVAPTEPRPKSPGARLGFAVAAALALLAAVETAQALIAPFRAPRDEQWAAVAAAVRGEFRAGDLIVAAPAWADPVMRAHLGDLLPISAAARLDDARFARVWEISQRGARAPEATGRAVAADRAFGRLRLRRWERAPAAVTYDFLESWRDAYVTRWNPAARSTVPCPWQVDRFACPTTGNSVQRALVEVDNRIRRAFLAPPVMGEVLAVDFPSVAMGRELVVGAGLHDTWARKSPGTVHFEVWIAWQPVWSAVVSNRTLWTPIHLDTRDRDGQVAAVRFQISSPRPDARYLSFAAEARR
ncbi:MAG: hypothetical protein ABUL77_02145 [Bacteroidota bacterium]